MAPELLYGEGYSYSADFWPCAVCMYEFMFDGLPFGESEEDHMNVYRQLLKSKHLLLFQSNLAFSKNVKDLEFKHLMKFMLCNT